MRAFDHHKTSRTTKAKSARRTIRRLDRSLESLDVELAKDIPLETRERLIELQLKISARLARLHKSA